MATRKNLYPPFIVLAIVTFIAFLAWSAMQASKSGPEVTDADYYSKGLRYTSTILEKKAATSLGWTIKTELSNRTLSIALNDKDGTPVTAANGSILFYLQETSERVEYPLQETTSGNYQFNLMSSLKGELSARIEFEREGARINRQLLLNL
jgi:nitrogen fixation protein FixH